VTARIDLSEATEDDAAVLGNLLQLYYHDFTDFEDWDIDEEGRFSEEPVQRWIAAETRHPFLIRVDGKLAGFALVDQGSRISDDPTIVDMGEFFVLRRYRRSGVGRHVAQLLFDRYPAVWEVRQLPRNMAAQAFWRRIIDEYTGGAYEDFVAPDGDTAQRFDSRRSPTST
jgi:predicted acetyltransferase